MHRIDKQIDRLMWPTAEASWVVLYEHTTIPRPPSWILKSYHKSAADWDIGTKFCVVVEISGKSALGCMSKIATGSKFKMAAAAIFNFVFESINIYAPNLVQLGKISSPRLSIGQKSHFRKSKMADGRHLEFWSYNKSAADWDIGTKFCVVVEINSGKSAVGYNKNSHRK